MIESPEGATPLSHDDMLGLKLKHIDTREQLNEVEAANIAQGQIWASKLKTGSKEPTLDDIFTRDFVTNLHQALFGEVWQWAGSFRQRELNIGVDPKNIAVDLYNLSKTLNAGSNLSIMTTLNCLPAFNISLFKYIHL